MKWPIIDNKPYLALFDSNGAEMARDGRGYVRAAMPPNSTNWHALDGQLVNALPIGYYAVRAWPPITRWALYTSIEGGGLVAEGAFDVPFEATGAGPHKIEPGALKLAAEGADALWRLAPTFRQ